MDSAAQEPAPYGPTADDPDTEVHASDSERVVIRVSLAEVQLALGDAQVLLRQLAPSAERTAALAVLQQAGAMVADLKP